MERVAIVVFSIVLATAIVVGASYGAVWLQPILLRIPTVWMIAASTTMVSLGGLIAHRRRNKRARV
jgi:Mg/Co/Ni transporter MgtE